MSFVLNSVRWKISNFSQTMTSKLNISPKINKNTNNLNTYHWLTILSFQCCCYNKKDTFLSVNESFCDQKCKGNSTQTCGGISAILTNIYDSKTSNIYITVYYFNLCYSSNFWNYQFLIT